MDRRSRYIKQKKILILLNVQSAPIILDHPQSIKINSSYTDTNIDDFLQYFATTWKHNQSATELRDTNTPTTQVQIKVNPR